MKQLYTFGLCVAALCTLALIACQGSNAGTETKPNVIIASPPHGSTFTVGQVVAVQSSAADVTGISRVELLVDGAQVQQDAPPSLPAPTQFTLIQNWTATIPGTHTVTVRASNPTGDTGETAITITVNAAGAPTTVALATPTLAAGAPTDAPIPSITPPPNATGCVPNSQFIADLTIPDRTVVAPGENFTKTWRVANNGNCAWESGSTLVFISGAQMASAGVLPLPTVQPGATTDLSVPMKAPTSPGDFGGTWRMRRPNGQLFGTTLTVVVRVPAPTTNAACNGTPNDFTFSASATSINKGDQVNLQWGPITNATGAFLSGGVFDNTGVETPGQRTVKPATTTTYELKAVCAPSGQNREKTLTINVTDNADLGPLNGNFTILVDGENEDIDEVHGKLVFRTFAGDIDPPFNGKDGGNIDHVDLFIYDDDHIVYKHTESTVKYCAFSGGDNGGKCNTFVFSSNNNHWPDNGPEILNGEEYTLRATAYSKDGRKKNAAPVIVKVFLK